MTPAPAPAGRSRVAITGGLALAAYKDRIGPVELESAIHRAV